MSPSDPRFPNVRVAAWLIFAVAAIAAFAFLAGSIRSSGANDAREAQLQAEADAADARAARIAGDRVTLLVALRATRDSLTDARDVAAVDAARADDAEMAYGEARERRRQADVAAEAGTAPVGFPRGTSDAELLELADSALTACTLARRSCAERARFAEASVAVLDSIVASQAREIEERKAIEAALRAMQPSFWDAAREVAVEAACGAGGAVLGKVITPADKELVGVAAGALVGVIACAIVVR